MSGGTKAGRGFSACGAHGSQPSLSASVSLCCPGQLPVRNTQLFNIADEGQHELAFHVPGPYLSFFPILILTLSGRCYSQRRNLRFRDGGGLARG